MNIGFEAKRVFHNKTGLGNYGRDLICVLSQYSPENKYFLYNPKSSKVALFEPNEENIFEKKPQTPFYIKFYNLWRQKGIVKDLIKDKITVFHGLSGELPLGLTASNIKSIVTIHDLIFVRYPHLYSFFDRKIHFYKFRKAARTADLVVAISEQTKNDIVEFLKIDPSKIKVIYQGCHEAFKKDYTEDDCKEVINKFNLPTNFILNVGTIEARKNVFLAVRAIKNINTCLVIIGKETGYAQQIKYYIEKNGLKNKVIFLKGLNIQELAIVYKLAKVFVYPSLYEGFGIPIIEALYSKTPVITSEGGVFPEAGGPNSIYVSASSVDNMEKSILQVLSNDTLYQEMTEKGWEFAQKFNDEKIAKEFNTIYKSLLSESKLIQ
jgi:glycosyltransferase involved in cell wall biosynthesis